MSKIDERKLLEDTNHLIHELFPDLIIRKTSLEDHNSFFQLRFYLEGTVAMEIKVDFMDSCMEFFMKKLDRDGNPFKYGYSVDPEGRSIRVYLDQILKYLNIPLDKKKNSGLVNLKPDFYLKENVNEVLMQKIKDCLLFFAPVLQNEQSIITQLQNAETWEKMK